MIYTNIEKQIKELDKNDIIDITEMYGNVYINFNNIFSCFYIEKTNKIEYDVIYSTSEEGGVDYDFYNDMNSGFNKIIGIATFLKENENNIKAIIKKELECNNEK